MAAPASDKNVSQTEFDVAEGWTLVTKYNKKGEIVKYYTDILGQRFYNESDLMRNIKNAKERGLEIYAPTEFEVPEGWTLVTKYNKKGEIVKYYTNILGHGFYNELDLMRNIKNGKERGLTIYAPDFKPPTTGPFAMPSQLKGEAGSTSTAEHTSRNNGRREGLKPKQEVCVKSKAETPGCASAQLGVVLDGNDIQCASALLELSFLSPRSIALRSSRRLAGKEPELCADADFGRPLEYIIKDKPKH